MISAWSWKETCIVAGDSIVSGLQENLLNKNGLNVKIKRFPGSTVDNMFLNIAPILKKSVIT